MSKHIDLAERIAEDQGAWPGLLAIQAALDWLDRNPDQVPGRTITPGDVHEIWDASHAGKGIGALSVVLATLGFTVAPEPTNSEHDRDWWVEFANVNDAEDCEACEGDLCPVHYGISMGINLMAKKIAALGDDPELFALIPDPVKEA
ncbi:hypothetical protein [Brevibacterium zhoupengii]|uniref:hypothetical protein n=1 Tax=Brevibacterium zhoupengii TaxID=2898795 RepID=UPI001F096BD6|nr:hypothetical protein [Brevibacterium zhoupengii]